MFSLLANACNVTHVQPFDKIEIVGIMRRQPDSGGGAAPLIVYMYLYYILYYTLLHIYIHNTLTLHTLYNIRAAYPHASAQILTSILCEYYGQHLGKKKPSTC